MYIISIQSKAYNGISKLIISRQNMTKEDLIINIDKVEAIISIRMNSANSVLFLPSRHGIFTTTIFATHCSHEPFSDNA